MNQLPHSDVAKVLDNETKALDNNPHHLVLYHKRLQRPSGTRRISSSIIQHPNNGNDTASDKHTPVFANPCLKIRFNGIGNCHQTTQRPARPSRHRFTHFAAATPKLIQFTAAVRARLPPVGWNGAWYGSVSCPAWSLLTTRNVACISPKHGVLI